MFVSPRQTGEGYLTTGTRGSITNGALRDFARLDESEVRQVGLGRDNFTCVGSLSTDAGNRVSSVRQYAEPPTP